MNTENGEKGRYSVMPTSCLRKKNSQKEPMRRGASSAQTFPLGNYGKRTGGEKTTKAGEKATHKTIKKRETYQPNATALLIDCTQQRGGGGRPGVFRLEKIFGKGGLGTLFW